MYHHTTLPSNDGNTVKTWFALDNQKVHWSHYTEDPSFNYAHQVFLWTIMAGLLSIFYERLVVIMLLEITDNSLRYIALVTEGTVYPKKYAHGFVVLCFVVVRQSFIMNSHEVFIHIHQGCLAGTGAIVRLLQCQWSKPDGYGKISLCITTTKRSKAKTVCIFLGIYCKTVLRRKSRRLSPSQIFGKINRELMITGT